MGGKRQALGDMDAGGGYTLKILIANKSAGGVIGKAGQCGALCLFFF
jgi:hypothetical protein